LKRTTIGDTEYITIDSVKSFTDFLDDRGWNNATNKFDKPAKKRWEDDDDGEDPRVIDILKNE
jgi:hypothetical protein